MRRLVVLCALAVAAVACGGSDGEDVAVQGTDPASDEVVVPAGVVVPDGVVLCDDLRAPELPTDGPISDDPDVAEAQRWRASMGLRSDEDWVREVADRPADDSAPEAQAFAHPLTADEAHDLLGRGSEAVGVDGNPSRFDLYAAQHPDTYGGLWIDNALGGVVTMAFTDSLEAHRAALPGVNLVQVEYSHEELEALQPRVGSLMPDVAYASGLDVQRNVVTIELYVFDQASVDAVAAAFAGEPVCVRGNDPALLVPEGPQPQGGAGWRLLADQPLVGAAWATGLEVDQAGYEQLWAGLALDGEAPAVDFATEIVVHFGPAVSGSCSEIRLDDVLVDRARSLLTADIVLPGKAGLGACTSDARPYTYLVAVQRDALPPVPFTIRLSDETDCGQCGETVVTDLG
jgi:hypothetical protein